MESTGQNFPAVLDEALNSKKAFFEAFKKRSRTTFLLFLISLIWSSGCLILFPSPNSSEVVLWLVILPWIILFLWVSFIYFEAREAFWKQLAVRYNWQYSAFKDISQEKALLFKIGHTHMAHNGIAGTYNGLPIHIFEYQYTVGSGKHSHTYEFTVFEVKFKGTFPHLYLNYKKDWYSNKPSLFADIAEISVPNEFKSKFKLYSPKEYEIETLEIFTPEVFSALLNLEWSHDMEFIDGELVIYRNSHFNSFLQLDAELGKIKKFVDILAPRLNRLKLSQIGNISPNF